MVLHLNKLEFQSLKNAMGQVWLKFGPVILEKRLLKAVNVILLCCNYLPLEKGVTLHLNKLEFLSPTSLVVLSQWFWGIDRRTTDNQKSTLELSALVS